MERTTEEDVVMITWKMEVGGHQKRRQKLRWSYVDKNIPEGETNKDRRNTRPENMDIEKSMCRPQIGKGPKIFYIIIVLEKTNQPPVRFELTTPGLRDQGWYS